MALVLKGRLVPSQYDGKNRMTLEMRNFLQSGERNETTATLAKELPHYGGGTGFKMPYTKLVGNGDFASVVLTYHKSDRDKWCQIEEMWGGKEVEVTATVRRYRYLRAGVSCAGISLVPSIVRLL